MSRQKTTQDRVSGLTEKEKDVLDAYIRHKSLTKASKALGISIQLASARKHRALMKYLKAKEVVKEYEQIRIRAPSLLDI